MKRHHIKIKKQPLDTQSILSHKDFNFLLNKYGRARRRSRLSKSALFAGVLVITLLIVYSLVKVFPPHSSKHALGVSISDSLPEKTSSITQLPPITSLYIPVPPTSQTDSLVKAQQVDRSTLPYKKTIKKETKNNLKHSIKKDSVSLTKKLSTLTTRQTLNEFLSSLVSSPQSFPLDGSTDTLIKTRGGVEIFIPSGSFQYENGLPHSKQLTFRVEEYHTLSEMVFASLTTTSNGLPLESGGMLHLVAMAEDEPLQIKKGKEITLKFPVRGEKKPMNLYLGDKINNRTLNWTLAQGDLFQEETLFVVTEIPPSFAGGMQAFKNYLQTNLQYPPQARQQGITGMVYIQFIVEKDGSISSVQVLKGLNQECDQEAVRLIENSPNWTPGRQGGKPVRVRMGIPVEFKLNADSPSTNTKLTPSPLKSNVGSNEESDNYYILKTQNLGWLNCDWLLTFNTQKTRLQVPSEDKEASVIVIFKNYKTVLPHSHQSQENIVFDNIPTDEEIILLGMKLVDDTPYVAFKDTILTEAPSQIINLTYEPTTKKEFKNKVRKILREY